MAESIRQESLDCPPDGHRSWCIIYEEEEEEPLKQGNSTYDGNHRATVDWVLHLEFTKAVIILATFLADRCRLAAGSHHLSQTILVTCVRGWAL